MDNELNFNNKKFLSSKHAGKLAGYTNDYVARLCRQGKVEGRMVGRAWYVDANSFISFLEKHSSGKEKRQKLLADERKKEYVNATPLQKKSLEHAPFKILGSASFLQKTGTLTVVFVFVFSVYISIMAGPMEIVYKTQRGYTAVSQMQKLFSEQGIKNTSEILAYQASITVSQGVASVSDSVKGLFVYVWKYTTGVFRSLVLYDRNNIVVESTPDIPTDDFMVEEGEKFALRQDRDGVVVVPSAGLTQDEERKKEIEKAFSDEIKIIPNKDGRSGIIQPVFKTQEEQDYLYVLVPIDEDGTEI